MKTDKEKTNEQIRNSNFKRIDFDPTSSHIQEVKQLSKKQFRETLRLLTTEQNTVIENLAIFVEKHCSKITDNEQTKINDSYYATDIFT